MSEIEMTPLVGKPARWLTNVARNEAVSVAASLRIGHANRDVVVGYPKATEQLSADVLHRMGMVGLYDAASTDVR